MCFQEFAISSRLPNLLMYNCSQYSLLTSFISLRLVEMPPVLFFFFFCQSAFEGSERAMELSSGRAFQKDNTSSHSLRASRTRHLFQVLYPDGKCSSSYDDYSHFPDEKIRTQRGEWATPRTLGLGRATLPASGATPARCLHLHGPRVQGRELLS